MTQNNSISVFQNAFILTQCMQVDGLLYSLYGKQLSSLPSAPNWACVSLKAAVNGTIFISGTQIGDVVRAMGVTLSSLKWEWVTGLETLDWEVTPLSE